ncbi:right-handed parallel beta-helix repeat-containing protein [Bacillus sp. FSL H8-0512]|uniref:right-handed parallel beta-helix repeat-containing protein n=1 Tax=Bacillus sp. FSL H8-0512 TaxID=2921395 RepID=UPI0030F818A1
MAFENELIPVNTLGVHDEETGKWIPVDAMALRSHTDRLTIEDILNEFETNHEKFSEIVAKNQKLSNSLDKLNSNLESISLNVMDYVVIGETDASLFIQRALDKAYDLGGASVYIPKGNYSLKRELIIKSNTCLFLSERAFMEKHHSEEMLTNFEKVKGSPRLAGYNGYSNITVSGGVWNANGLEFKSGQGLVFAHAKNITVENMEIYDVCGGHAVELNGIDNGLIRKVKAFGYEGEDFRGAFQIDLDSDGTPPTLGSFSSFDGTPCKNITVKECVVGSSEKMKSWGRGVESHSSIIGRPHVNIKVLNNDFYNTKNAAIRAYAWDNVLIKHNRVFGCGSGIVVNPPLETKPQDTLDSSGKQTNRSQDQYEVIIDSNLIDGTTMSDGLLGGISIWGQSTGTLIDVKVVNNTIKNTFTSSNGIYAQFLSRSLIEGNIIVNAGQNGISVTGSRYLKLTNNHIEKCSITGIYIGDGNSKNTTTPETSSYIDVRGNTVNKAGGHGIHFTDSSKNNQVKNNTIIDAGQSENNRFNGIYISTNSKNTTIHNNDIYSASKKLIAGIYITGTTNSILEKDNFIPDNNYFESKIVNELIK